MFMALLCITNIVSLILSKKKYNYTYFCALWVWYHTLF